MANTPKVSQEAVDAAWTLAETLTFDRVARKVGFTDMVSRVGTTDVTLRAWECGEFLPGLAAFVAWAIASGYEVVLVPGGDG